MLPYVANPRLEAPLPTLANARCSPLPLDQVMNADLRSHFPMRERKLELLVYNVGTGMF